MTKKNELLKSISNLEAKIVSAKQRNELEKGYIKQCYESNPFVLISTLLPAFLVGWKEGKKIRGKPRLKNYLKRGIVTFGKIILKIRP